MAVKTASRLMLARRPRRLRRTDAIRRLVRETHLTPDCFVLPLFVCEGSGVRREVSSMPGVFQLSVDEAVKEAAAAKADGVPGVLLFGLPERKDAVGSLAADPEAPVQSAVREMKRHVPDLDRHHRRLPLRVHVARPLRHPRRRRDRQRRHRLAPGAGGAVARGGGRRLRRAVGHDGRARRRDPAGARRARLRARRHHFVRGEVLLGVLRSVPRRRRFGAAVRRSPQPPDGSRRTSRRRCARSRPTWPRAPTSSSSSRR